MRRIGLLFPLLAIPLSVQPARGQELPQGVRLSVEYQAIPRPTLAVRPFGGTGELAVVAAQVTEIVERDLDYSDRFEMVPVPPSLATGPVDYRPWRDLGVDYLLTGTLEPRDGGYLLRLTLYDVVYSRVHQIRAFGLPVPTQADFRMSVHATADEVVFWATGQPGKAASRVAFVREAAEGGWELVTVDSDGANLRRVVHSPNQILYSPAWSPDGTRIVYSVQDIEDGSRAIHERDLASGAVRVLSARPGLNVTPTYSPDGRRVAFALSRGNTEAELYDMDAVQRCCVRQLTRAGPATAELSPTYSPDGRQIAFMSDRIGQAHIYIMPADGGQPIPLTRFVAGQRAEYASPDWSPTGERVAFHATFGDGRGYQIMLANPARPGATVEQITLEGRNQDPSWAPNGRHLVFTSVRGNERGLYVIDTATKRIRPLVTGGRYVLPAWSPTLKRASALAISGP